MKPGDNNNMKESSHYYLIKLHKWKSAVALTACCATFIFTLTAIVSSLIQYSRMGWTLEDYFRYFMPMSGSLYWGDDTTVPELEQMTPAWSAEFLVQSIAASGYSADDYFVYAITGDHDSGRHTMTTQIQALKQYPEFFRYTENYGPGNLFFRIADRERHNYTAETRYLYNALPVFLEKMNG